MNVEPPQLDSVPATELDFKRKMAELASKGVEYILFAHTNTDNIIHGGSDQSYSRPLLH